MGDEDFDIFVEDFVDFLSGLEASIVKMRSQIEMLVGRKVKPRWDWSPEFIEWEKAQGSKGEFEKAEEVNNPHFKIMLKDLDEHGGKLMRDGLFYWVYRNGHVVGRKKRIESGR